MFRKSGTVVKVIAHIVFWGELIASFALVFSAINTLVTVLAIIIGPISAYLSACFIYSIGESADYVIKNNEKLDFVDSKSSNALFNQDKLLKRINATMDELGEINSKIERLNKRIEYLIENNTCCEDSSVTIWYVAKNDQAVKTTESELTLMIIDETISPETLVVNSDIKDWTQVCQTDLWKKVKNVEEEIDEK